MRSIGLILGTLLATACAAADNMPAEIFPALESAKDHWVALRLKNTGEAAGTVRLESFLRSGASLGAQDHEFGPGQDMEIKVQPITKGKIQSFWLNLYRPSSIA